MGIRQTVNFPSSWGTIHVDMENKKVVACRLPFLKNTPRGPFTLQATGSDPLSRFMHNILSGRKTNVPELGKLPGTDFQHDVWSAIAAIETGKTRSYGELAEEVGRQHAVRAVGTACGRNPVPLFIPCHRVLGAHGGLGGFSAGIAWKKLLLSLEDVSLSI